MEPWFLLSLLAAVFDSCRDCLFKWKLKSGSPFLIMLSVYIFAIPIIAPWLYFSGIPKIGDAFLGALFVAGALEVSAAYLFVRSVGYSDISLVIPFVSFSPAFLVLWSPIFLGESLSLGGIAGVFLIVCGSYLMNLNLKSYGFWSPFSAVLRDRGARYMLAAALCWSFLAAFCKIGVVSSSPAFWSLSFCLWSGFIAYFFLIRTSAEWRQELRDNFLPLFILGLVVGGTMVAFFTAIGLQKAAYVVAVKRISILFSVVLGYLIFKESETKQRFIGALVMLVGVAAISASN